MELDEVVGKRPGPPPTYRVIFRSTGHSSWTHDACDLRLLGLRTTVEVLKQLPVILEAKPVDADSRTFYSPDENVRRAAAFAPAPLQFCSRSRRSRSAPTREETVTEQACLATHPVHNR